jgi:hypothetical protein
MRWKCLGAASSVHRASLQGTYTGVRPWRNPPACRYSGDSLAGRRGGIGQISSEADLPREFHKNVWWEGGGLKTFAPKSFVGKHFIGHIHLRAISEVNKGRWVYEGSELKAIWKKPRTTLTFH